MRALTLLKSPTRVNNQHELLQHEPQQQHGGASSQLPVAIQGSGFTHEQQHFHDEQFRHAHDAATSNDVAWCGVLAAKNLQR